MNMALLVWATCGAALSLVADVLFKRQCFWGGCGLYMLASYPAFKAFQVGAFGQTIFLWELLFVLCGSAIGRIYFSDAVTVKHIIGVALACVALWLLSAQDGGRP